MEGAMLTSPAPAIDFSLAAMELSPEGQALTLILPVALTLTLTGQIVPEETPEKDCQEAEEEKTRMTRIQADPSLSLM